MTSSGYNQYGSQYGTHGGGGFQPLYGDGRNPSQVNLPTTTTQQQYQNPLGQQLDISMPTPGPGIRHGSAAQAPPVRQPAGTARSGARVSSEPRVRSKRTLDTSQSPGPRRGGPSLSSEFVNQGPPWVSQSSGTAQFADAGSQSLRAELDSLTARIQSLEPSKAEVNKLSGQVGDMESTVMSSAW